MRKLAAAILVAAGTVVPLGGADGGVLPGALPLTMTWTVDVDPLANVGPALTADRLFLATRAHEIQARGMADGQVLWTAPSVETTMDLIASAGLVFATTADGITALDEQTGDVQWRTSVETSTLAPPVARSGWVFVVTPSGVLKALRASNGDLVWEYALGGAPTAAPAIEGALLVVTLDGPKHTSKLVGITVAPTKGTRAWEYLATAAPGPPTVSHDLVYFSLADGSLWCLNGRTGQPEWPAPSTLVGRMTSAIAIDDQRIYAAALDGQLMAFGRAHGDLEWKTDIKARALAPFVEDGLVLVPLRRGIVTVYFATGKPGLNLRPPPSAGADTQMQFVVSIGHGPSVSIVSLTDSGSTWSINAFGKAHLMVTSQLTAVGTRLPPVGPLTLR